MTQQPILVLTTGGTIDKQYFDASSQYTIVGTMVTRLLELGRVAHPFEIEEVMRKDSLEMDDTDRATIAGRAAASPATRIVITHGTDTMTETTKALTGIEGKTIVLVG
ncbi:asparaginase, partial [Klebsiella michiganensis]|nr:asparaginase [Klebsiella michiganensis]